MDEAVDRGTDDDGWAEGEQLSRVEEEESLEMDERSGGMSEVDTLNSVK